MNEPNCPECGKPMSFEKGEVSPEINVNHGDGYTCCGVRWEREVAETMTELERRIITERVIKLCEAIGLNPKTVIPGLTTPYTDSKIILTRRGAEELKKRLGVEDLTAQLVAEALGQNPDSPGTARLAADLKGPR